MTKQSIEQLEDQILEYKNIEFLDNLKKNLKMANLPFSYTQAQLNCYRTALMAVLFCIENNLAESN